MLVVPSGVVYLVITMATDSVILSIYTTEIRKIISILRLTQKNNMLAKTKTYLVSNQQFCSFNSLLNTVQLNSSFPNINE